MSPLVLDMRILIPSCHNTTSLPWRIAVRMSLIPFMLGSHMSYSQQMMDFFTPLDIPFCAFVPNATFNISIKVTSLEMYAPIPRQYRGESPISCILSKRKDGMDTSHRLFLMPPNV